MSKDITGKGYLAYKRLYMEETLADVKQQRDQAYFERNQLVAYLAQNAESHIYNYKEDGEGSDWFVVCVHLPQGQATWHVHKRELQYFAGIPRDNNNHWDGHTTDQKYYRMLYGEIV